MPSKQRREDTDLRNGRFESEISYDVLERIQKDTLEGKRTRVYRCSECGTLFEERSLYCPRCDKKTMCVSRTIENGKLV